MKATALLTCCLIFLLGACAAPWQLVERSVVQGGDGAYRVELPEGWMRYAKGGEDILISRDGPGLQSIKVRCAGHKEAFEAIDKRSSAEMLPSELAELAIALIKNEKEMTRVEVTENRPALVAGRDGFRLYIAYENQRGLNYEGVIYGLADQRRVYLMIYIGTSLYYFPRDLPAFEAMVESFRLTAS